MMTRRNRLSCTASSIVLSSASGSVALRPYQQHDVARLRLAYADGNRAVLYCLPTGGGKTIVFIFIVSEALRKGRRIAILVHRRELVKQASDKLTAAGIRHGIIGAGLDRDHDAPVLVMSVQTAARRLDQLPAIDFVVVDEAHHVRATIWRAVLDCWPDARLLGVTATPARTDGKGLGVKAGGLFDTLVIGASVIELQAEGYLARTRCFVPQNRIDVSGLRTRLGDWEADALAERANVVTGSAIDEYRKHADHTAAIAYCATVRHAEDVAATFRSAGYRSRCVYGGLASVERDALIAALGSGEIEILTSCDLISEGFDVPDVRAVLLLRPTQSLVLALQQIGRGMRPAPGKSHLTVLDFAGNVLRHGLPETGRTWSLDGVPKKPPGAGSALPQTASRCEECGCVNGLEAEECEECGASRPGGGRRSIPDHQPGQLTEVTADYFARIVHIPYRQFLSAPRTERELRVYAAHRGYRSGWVWHRLREQQANNGGNHG